jgi:hypothetical protein
VLANNEYQSHFTIYTSENDSVKPIPVILQIKLKVCFAVCMIKRVKFHLIGLATSDV